MGRDKVNTNIWRQSALENLKEIKQPDSLPRKLTLGKLKRNTACNRIKYIFYTTNSYLLTDPSLESLQKMEPENEEILFS